MSDNHDLLNDNDMCSFSGYEVDDMCSNNGIDTCGVRSFDNKSTELNTEKGLKTRCF